MDAKDEATTPSAPVCGWCGKDATRELRLRPGRVTAKRTILPVIVPVCEMHWQHFTEQDEIGATTDQPGGW